MKVGGEWYGSLGILRLAAWVLEQLLARNNGFVSFFTIFIAAYLV